MTLQIVIDAINEGSSVTCYGNRVSVQGKYDWQEKKLMINLASGAAYVADDKDISSMFINNTKISKKSHGVLNV